MQEDGQLIAFIQKVGTEAVDGPPYGLVFGVTSFGDMPMDGIVSWNVITRAQDIHHLIQLFDSFVLARIDTIMPDNELGVE